MQKVLITDHIVVQMVTGIRKDHPRMGGRKIYYLIKSELKKQNIKMGRDALFDLLAIEQMLIRKRRRKIITTNSKHWYKKYPNLIKGFTPNEPNQLWVSDITYIRTNHGFMYLFLITDAYSRKVVGYRLSKDLSGKHAVSSLQDAMKNICKPMFGLIHHSDRGIQYCSNTYVKLLQDYSIRISMTENGDPLENAIAERVNGILKQEYLCNGLYNNGNITTSLIKSTIEKYNDKRPHLSCNMLTPNQAHLTSGILKRKWKNYYKKIVTLNI